MRGLNFNVKSVKQYPYRTARITNILLTFDRNDPSVRKIEDELSAKSGNRVDNHTVYELRKNENSKLYMMFTDTCAHIGDEIEVRNW